LALVRAGSEVFFGSRSTRILRKHGYPPDKQENATQTVLGQAAVLSEGWVGVVLAAIHPAAQLGLLTALPLGRRPQIHS
jgi:hypothetical protein